MANLVPKVYEKKENKKKYKNLYKNLPPRPG